MSRTAFFFWGLLLTIAAVIGLILLGVPPSPLWSIPFGFLMGVGFRILARRRSQ